MNLSERSNEREQELQRIQAWIEEGVLLFGGSRISAVWVGETFAEGIRLEWQRQRQEQEVQDD